LFVVCPDELQGNRGHYPFSDLGHPNGTTGGCVPDTAAGLPAVSN
jgi:hypothetical protein